MKHRSHDMHQGSVSSISVTDTLMDSRRSGNTKVKEFGISLSGLAIRLRREPTIMTYNFQCYDMTFDI
jgi:hypothetical protein